MGLENARGSGAGHPYGENSRDSSELKEHNDAPLRGIGGWCAIASLGNI